MQSSLVDAHASPSGTRHALRTVSPPEKFTHSEGATHPIGSAQPRSRSPPSGQSGVTQIPFAHSPGAQHVAPGPQLPPKSMQQLGALANSYVPQISPAQHEPSAHCSLSPWQAEPVEPPPVLAELPLDADAEVPDVPEAVALAELVPVALLAVAPEISPLEP